MKILVEFSVLVGTAIKALKQVAEMKLKLSVCILIPTLAVLYTQLNPNVWEYQSAVLDFIYVPHQTEQHC